MPETKVCTEQRLAEVEAKVASDPAEAAALALGLIESSEYADDHLTLGRALRARGMALAYLDDIASAMTTLRGAHEALGAAGDRRWLSVVACDLATLRGNQLGQTAAAIDGFNEALRLAAEAGAIGDEGRALSLLGSLFGRMERFDDAERALRHAVGLLDRAGSGYDSSNASNNLGYLLLLRGRPQEARATLEAAAVRVDPRRDPHIALTLQCSLALARATLGEIEPALVTLLQAEPLLARSNAFLRVDFHQTLGRLHLLAGRAPEAAQALAKALASAHEFKLDAPAAECLLYLAQAAEQSGDLVAALAHERELRQVERRLIDARSAAQMRSVEITLQLEATQRENGALEAARHELAQRVDERTAELRAEVEERRRAELRAAQLARVDWLTELPNRRHFEAALRERIEATRAGVLGLCFVDLDRFKSVNDRYGHEVGDDLLRATAARLSAVVPEGALVARFGGDEFVLLVEAADAQGVEQLAERIVQAFQDALPVGAQGLQLSCSVGVAVYPDDASDGEALLQRADNALLGAKRAGRSCWAKLDPAAWVAVAHRTRVLAELAGAVERGEMSLVYQPQWELRERRCTALEALLRWHHPALGSVSPAEFIPMAEDSGLIGTIGLWVLREACLDALRIDAHAGAALDAQWTLAVNVSVRQLQQPGFADSVAHVLRATNWPARRLELEVTESLQLFQSDTVMANVAALADTGVHFALDDFGTGYASFAHLDWLRFSKLKIDRSLVERLETGANRHPLTQAVIALGHALGLSVTAEGVETSEQMHTLIRQGCDSVQGYLLARPMRIEAVMAALAKAPAALDAPAERPQALLHRPLPQAAQAARRVVQR